MDEFVNLLFFLLQAYLALGIILVGFGLMSAGPHGAKKVARWFFLQPIVWLLRTTWLIFVSFLRWLFRL